MKNVLWNIKFEVQFWIGMFLSTIFVTHFDFGFIKLMTENKKMYRDCVKIAEKAKTKDEYYIAVKEKHPELTEMIDEMTAMRKLLEEDPNFQEMIKDLEKEIENPNES